MIYFSLIRENGSKLDPDFFLEKNNERDKHMILKRDILWHGMLCYPMLWYGMKCTLIYGVSMLWISMVCYAMVYVVKDK